MKSLYMVANSRMVRVLKGFNFKCKIAIGWLKLYKAYLSMRIVKGASQMPITYKSFKDETYYLHSKRTKKGNMTYYFSKKAEGATSRFQMDMKFMKIPMEECI